MRLTTIAPAIVAALTTIGFAMPNLAGAAVGRTPAQFDVSSSGEATYRIPLSLPRGTAGMTPQLTLAYSSNNPNGWLGMGFTIPEFSMISRCMRTNAQDGGMGPFEPNFGTTDVFCIDANRLRLVSGATYGAAGTTYQTELESFRKITILGTDSFGPTGFQVRAPDGRIYSYGMTTDSRIRLVTVSGSLSSIRLHWALNKIEDRAGNAIEFSYAQDLTRGGYWPTEIRYTSHIGGTTPLYKVVFVNETADRPDPILNRLTYTGSAASRQFDFTKRLSRVDVVYIPTSTIARRYELTYLPIGSTVKHSFIQSVRECGAGGVDCLTPTTFNWNTPTLSQGGTTTGPSIPSGVSPFVMDLNGDLRTDLVWSSATGSGTWLYALASGAGGFDSTQNTTIANTGHANAVPIEWNGDGRLDLIVPGSDNTWKVLRANGAGFDAPISTGIAYNSVSGFFDTNGDGLDDLVYFTSSLKVRVNTGSGFGAETAGVAYVWPIVKIYTPRTAKRQDFDGDSLEDVIVQYDEIVVGPSGSTHTLKLKAIHGAGAALRLGTDYGATQYVGTGDFNGDKVTDVAYILSGRVYTSLSTTAGPLASSAVIADWDGYGLDDLLIPSGGIWQYAPSLGTTFGAVTSTGVAVSGTGTGDFDADGVADLIGVTAGTVRVVGHFSIVPWPLYGTMLSAKDGYDLGATFDYGLLNDPQVHTTTAAPVFPVSRLTSPLPVVRTLTANDAVSGSSTYAQTFKYENGFKQLTGRGFLGFAKRTVQDSRTSQLSVEETYRQDFPYIGALVTRKLRQNTPDQTIKNVTNSWTKISYGNRDFPYVSQSVSEQYELGGTYNGVKYSTITTYVDAIDSASGLQTDVRVTVAENATGLYTGAVTTRRTYISSVLNDTANWCLGRPQTIQQINSHTTMPGGTQLTRTSSATWDGVNCRLQQQKIEPNDALWEVTTNYGYDTFGNVNLTTVIPAANQGQGQRLTSVNWGVDGRAPRTTTNPKGHQTQLTWDFDAATGACPAASAVLGQLRCVTDPNLLTTRLDYDAFGRLSREQRPDGTGTSYSILACNIANNYCGNNGLDSYIEIASRDSANGPIQTDIKYFDGLDRPRYDCQQMLNGGNGCVIRNYDALGRTSSQSAPYVSGTANVWFTNFTYDSLNRTTLIQRQANENDSSTATTQIAYQGLKAITTDPLLHSSTSVHNATGQVVQMIDAAGGDTDYEYDVFSNLLKTRDFNGNEITLTYNVRGLKMTSSDPDMGNWSYGYYPLGELKTQTDAKGQTMSFTYDELSRPLSRTDQPEGMTSWEWDTATKGVGRLKGITSPGGGYGEIYSYDSLGRTQTSGTIIDGTTYTYTYGYEPTQGTLQTLQYPNSVGAPFKVQYDYQNGHLLRVKDFNAPTTVFWQANATDARNQVIDQQLGSGLQTINTYDAITGAINRIDSGFGGGSAEQQLRYTWNKVGSLSMREDLNQGTLNETFEYDVLDRLDIVRRNGSTTQDMAYDAIGNITSKLDVGSYTYHATKKHAVTAAGANTYGYDTNGNVSSRNGQSISWYSYNLPYQINAAGGKYAKFWYGADRQRYKQEHHALLGGSSLRTTIYAGGLFEKVTDAGFPPFYRHLVTANGRTVAIHGDTLVTSTVITWDLYPAMDHLGSVDVIQSDPTDLERRYSYDAFGKRRGTNWSGNPTNDELENAWFDSSNRGFTGHEHLDNVGGLIHMNGRVYDPVIGRFLSADPFVQAPYYSQSLNRYSYVFNNPLTFTDPSGFESEGFGWSFSFDASWGLAPWWSVRYVDPGKDRRLEAEIAAGKNIDGTKVPGTVMAIQSHPILPYANAYENLKTEAHNWSNHEVVGWDETNPEFHCSKAGCWRDQDPGAVTRSSITRGDLLRGGAEVAVTLGTLGAATPEVVATRVGLAEARVARNALARELAPLGRKAPATVTAGYNRVTGQVAARACGGGKCAEDHVVEALGGKSADISFTEAIRPRTFEEVPICLVCEGKYGRDAFPPDTIFKSGP